MVIDLFGLTLKTRYGSAFPKSIQWVYERVKPERDQNNRDPANNWWLFGRTTAKLRAPS